MNSTSFGEVGGNVARVVLGRLRVGWPGAPGCTIEGATVSACCACAEGDKQHSKMPAPKSVQKLSLIPDISTVILTLGEVQLYHKGHARQYLSVTKRRPAFNSCRRRHEAR